MMAGQHTQGEIKVREDYDYHIVSESGTICGMSYTDNYKANAARIVKCWNMFDELVGNAANLLNAIKDTPISDEAADAFNKLLVLVAKAEAQS